MKESTLVQMRRDIKNLSITVAILIERLKKLEEKTAE